MARHTDIKGRLKDLIDCGLRRYGFRGKSFTEMGTLISEFLQQGEWDAVSDRFRSRLDKVTDEVKSLSLPIDAAEYLDSKVTSASNRKFFEMVLKKYDFDSWRDLIRGSYATGKIPDRGFVYVAWRKRPETYYYVGLASSNNRIDLTGHGKLTEALRQATCLSLIFPGQSTHETLAGVEAALLSLIEIKMGGMPTLNIKRELVRPHIGSTDLSVLAGMLRRIAKTLED